MDKNKFLEKYLYNKETHVGKLLKYQVDEVLLPSGEKTVREVVKHPGAVAIVAIFSDGKIIFVKQYRYAIDNIIYEIPAGKLSPGENPIDCAKRELKEETGYSAAKWTKLSSIFTVPGFCDEVIHIYKAEQLTAGEQQLDEDELIETFSFTQAQIQDMVNSQCICDAKTLAGLFLCELNK